MTMKLGIYPGYNGKFLLIHNKNIIYDKNIPYLEDEKIIKYGLIPTIINEIRTKAQEFGEKIDVFIVSNCWVREKKTSKTERLVCQGMIQGILLTSGIKYRQVSHKKINRAIKTPYRQVEKNRQLYLIMNYGKDIIDLEKDKLEGNVLSDILIMLNIDGDD